MVAAADGLGEIAAGLSQPVLSFGFWGRLEGWKTGVKT